MFIALISVGNLLQSQENANATCEKPTMAQVYACLEEERLSSLETVFTNLRLKLSFSEQTDLIDSLPVIQRAWIENITTYCDILVEVASAHYGLYANDIGNNCRAKLYARRVEDLVKLIEAVEDKNFEYWVHD